VPTQTSNNGTPIARYPWFFPEKSDAWHRELSKYSIEMTAAKRKLSRWWGELARREKEVEEREKELFARERAVIVREGQLNRQEQRQQQITASIRLDQDDLRNKELALRAASSTGTITQPTQHFASPNPGAFTGRRALAPPSQYSSSLNPQGVVSGRALAPSIPLSPLPQSQPAVDEEDLPRRRSVDMGLEPYRYDPEWRDTQQ